jgi:hypothetical protein
MTTRITKEEIARSSELRYRKAFGWLTVDEVRVIQRALETYAELGPETSWPIKLARDLLKGATCK